MKNVMLKTLILAFVTLFISCSNNNEYLTYTEDQIKYFEENLDYIRERKTLTDENGNLVYQQIIINQDTALYRVLEKTGDAVETASNDTRIKMVLEGELIDGSIFQPLNPMTFTPSQVITGLGAILLKNKVGEKIEAIIPANLGYGYYGVPVPAGSTLIFTYTVESFN